MDRKSIIVLLVSFALIMGWVKMVEHLYPPSSLSPESTNVVSNATNLLSTNVLGGATNPSIAPLREASNSSVPTPATTIVMPKSAEETLILETADVRYVFTSHGGGVKWVELKNFNELPAPGQPKFATNPPASLNTRAPVPMVALLGGVALEDDAPFKLTKTDTGVRAEKQLASGLALVKDFSPGSNYLLRVTARLENRSGRALVLPAQEWVMGTATPVDAQDNGQLLGVNWYNGTKAEPVAEGWFANRTLGCFPGTPRGTFSGEGNVVWAAVNNRFFTTIAMPASPAPQMIARKIELPAIKSNVAPNSTVPPFGFQSALLYPGLMLGSETSNNFVQREFTLYTGPKEYNHLAKLGLQMKNNVDLVMNYGGFFGFFAKGLLLSMNGLHALGLSYALCIISITVIIKLIFWPLTAVSTKSMKRMQELQPQIKALQERHKDDQAKMNTKMMEFYRENKVNPMAGCLPMLIQIPVFMGFYTMLQSAIELRGETFLWAADLSQTDTVGYFMGFPINPLPLIMGALSFWQASLTPPSPGMDPAQQKMMRFMPLMFIFMFYTMSSGLTLYWTVQNILTIVQMKLTNAKPDVEIIPPPTPGKRK